MFQQICKFFLCTSLIVSSITIAAETAQKNALIAKKEAVAEKKAQPNPLVILQTSMGKMTIELFADKAPETVKNFLRYVDKGFYDGVIFHRIIPNFMVQTGGFSTEYHKKKTSAPIINESNNGLNNERGTLSMARTGDPHSATAQFFINLVNNVDLDFKPGRLGMPNQHGYAVFGKVVSGIDVIDKMAAQPQGKHRSMGHGQFVNAPNEQIILDKAFRVKTEEAKPKAGK